MVDAGLVLPGEFHVSTLRTRYSSGFPRRVERNFDATRADEINALSHHSDIYAASGTVLAIPDVSVSLIRDRSMSARATRLTGDILYLDPSL
jgi:hypothetical protein